jgi:polynucleotide 5'-kinase involved in rRNA processing
MSMLSFSAHAQESREEWSKEFKKPNLNVEDVATLLATQFNQNKGKTLDSNTRSLGSTAVKKNINIDNQMTNQLNEAQIEKIKRTMPGITSKQICSTPMMYVLVKEHGLTVSYRWYDLGMKEVLISVVDATVCK